MTGSQARRLGCGASRVFAGSAALLLAIGASSAYSKSAEPVVALPGEHVRVVLARDVLKTVGGFYDVQIEKFWLRDEAGNKVEVTELASRSKQWEKRDLPKLNVNATYRYSKQDAWVEFSLPSDPSLFGQVLEGQISLFVKSPRQTFGAVRHLGGRRETRYTTWEDHVAFHLFAFKVQVSTEEEARAEQRRTLSIWAGVLVSICIGMAVLRKHA